MQRSESVGTYKEGKSYDYGLEQSIWPHKAENSKFMESTWKIEGQMEGFRESLNRVEGNNIYLQTQLGFYESEVRKMNEKVVNERKEWIKVVERMKEELREMKNEKFFKGNDVDQSFRMQREIFAMQERETELLRENLEIKQRFEDERLELIQRIVKKDEENAALQRELREVCGENSELRKFCEKLRFDLRCLGEEIDELRKSCKNAEVLQKKIENFGKSKVFLSESEKKEQISCKRMKKQVSGSQFKAKLCKKCVNPNFSRADVRPMDFGRTDVYVGYDTNKEKILKEKVRKLETEIAEVNKDYKKLLTSTKPGSSTHLKYKKEIDGIAKMLEAKSKSLFNAKRRYSSLIRQQSISRDFD